MPSLLYRPFRGTGGSLLLPHAPLPISFDVEGVGEVPQETWEHIKSHPDYAHLGFEALDADLSPGEMEKPSSNVPPSEETEAEDSPGRGRGRPPKNR